MSIDRKDKLEYNIQSMLDKLLNEEDSVDESLCFSGFEGKIDLNSIDQETTNITSKGKGISKCLIEKVETYHELDEVIESSILKNNTIDEITHMSLKSNYYKICDIEFKDISSILLDGNLSLLDYY